MPTENYAYNGTVWTDHTIGGYSCGNCGTWVVHGRTHACSQPSTYFIAPTTFTTIDSQRLAELMEAERKLSEIRRILSAE